MILLVLCLLVVYEMARGSKCCKATIKATFSYEIAVLEQFPLIYFVLSAAVIPSGEREGGRVVFLFSRDARRRRRLSNVYKKYNCK